MKYLIFFICWIAFIIIFYNVKKSKEKVEFNYAKYVCSMKLLSGLPVTSGSTLRVGYGANGMCFKTKSREYNIDFEQLRDIEIVNRDQINIAGAITGYAFFGEKGALFGAAASGAMVVSYRNKNGLNKKIYLDIYGAFFAPVKICRDFKKRKPPTQTPTTKIDL